MWPLRFARNVLLWLLPVGFLWLLVTPAYNRFLATSAENLLRLTERPDATRLLLVDPHNVVVSRRDFPPARSSVYSVRVTDLHFPLLLLGALFLGVPGVPWRSRLANLGWAALISIFFHIFLLFFWVKFVYATQLGSWSLENYGPLARNLYGLTKHLLDLPIKLALPFVLWAGFYLRRVLPAVEGARR